MIEEEELLKFGDDAKVGYTIGEEAKYSLILEPELSEWRCHLFGGGPNNGLTWRPAKGKHPNWFWRWTQFIIFGNRWEKDKK